MASINLELKWIPPAKLRGNAKEGGSRRGSINYKAAVVRDYRAKGKKAGEKLIEQGVKPLTGKKLGMYVQIQRRDNIKFDLLNFVFGYKAFEDGLVESGIIPDDRHVEEIIAQKKPKGKNNYTWLSYTELE